MDAPLLLSPSEAQKQYGFSGSLLRRYALIYEAQGGTIHRDNRGGRLYTAELLEHFRTASERVATGETVEAALKTLTASEELTAQGETLSESTEYLRQQTAQSGEVLEVLRRVLGTQEAFLNEMRGLRKELLEASVAKAELEALRLEVAELKASRGGALRWLERFRAYVVDVLKTK